MSGIARRFGSASSYTDFDATGHQTMVGDGRPWRDESNAVTTVQVLGTGVSLNSTEGTADFTTAANLSDYLWGDVQLNHDRDPSAKIYPHIHWFAAEQGVVPNFLLRYRWQSIGAAKVTGWTDYLLNTMGGGTPGAGQTWHVIGGNSTGITPPAATDVSDIFQFRIFRDNSNASGVFAGADAYTATVGVLSFDIHIQLNSLGSTDEYTK